ncbi:hypothetical protein OIE66_05285 [Nonomuraea sp. NBC_01738]|nr:hypothetical protein OIE66_05285 [Nonomuraea sp. NBC_01738]
MLTLASGWTCMTGDGSGQGAEGVVSCVDGTLDTREGKASFRTKAAP